MAVSNAASKAPGAKDKAPAKKAEGKAPEGEKKPRAPRTDYGYSPASVITVDTEKEVKYRGNRLAWYEILKAHNGKTVEAFEAKAKETQKEAPRGWLRFFVQDKACTLTKPKTEAETK